MTTANTLRSAAEALDCHEWDNARHYAAVCRYAADELDRLRSELINQRVRCDNERQGSCRGFKTPGGE